MSSSWPDACFLTAAYIRDGQWTCQHIQVSVALVGVAYPCCEEGAARPKKAKRADAARRVLCLGEPSQPLADVLRDMCTSRLGRTNALELEKRLIVRLHEIPLLSSCRVGGERFGSLSHFSRVIEETSAPNIVLFCCSKKRFFVVSSKSKNTQQVHTKSALCWLRTRAGLGFAYDFYRGVSLVDVSRDRCAADDAPWWQDAVTKLVVALPSVFPTCTFDES